MILHHRLQSQIEPTKLTVPKSCDAKSSKIKDLNIKIYYVLKLADRTTLAMGPPAEPF